MTINEACENALWRCVSTETKDGAGSGVVITTGVVLSCFHCLHAGSDITVDGEEAEILAVDTKYDLVLLSTKTLETPPIVIGFPTLGEQVICVCNPSSLDDVLLFGRVAHTTEERIASDIHGSPGVSGSGLFNTTGQLIGVNHSVMGNKHIGDWLTLAVPSQKLQRILATALRIVQPTKEEVEKYGAKTGE